MGREGGSSKTCLWVVVGQLVLAIPCSECCMFCLLCFIFSMIETNIFWLIVLSCLRMFLINFDDFFWREINEDLIIVCENSKLDMVLVYLM